MQIVVVGPAATEYAFAPVEEVLKRRGHEVIRYNGAAPFLAKSDVPSDPLTTREREVLQLVAQGMTTKKVAGLLGVSVKTAESHRHRIMDKLDLHDTASLVRYSIRCRLIEP